MDKILAFSILSSSPADIAAAGGYSTRFSWRTSSGNQKQQQQQQAEKAPKQEKAERKGSSVPERKPEARPRFAPEFDGLNCFESIVS